MCGICGFTGNNRELIKSMVSELRHRGPDDQSFYTNDYFSLGMSRLAVLDLISGNQPIWNEDKTIGVISNGEIYNYKLLRESLEQKGHQFYTNSDTEVLTHLYEEHKFRMTSYLSGMFAFCICDLKENKLFIARDRFGEKPLYYFLNDQHFIFSSELKSLLTHPGIKRILNQSQLDEFISLGFTTNHSTLFKNVYTLPPGNSLIYQNNSVTIQSYFTIKYQNISKLNDHQALIEKGRSLLIHAVEKQMVSDVPIGAFLSGGIDSSTVVAIMQQLSASKINTFHVRFAEKEYDESRIARVVANYVGSEHHEIYIPNQTFDESIFWTILNHVGFPFADSSAIPTYLVAREIKKHVTVALSGDGGDELFGGYSDFNWGLKINKLRSIPSFIRNPVYNLLKSLQEISSADFIRKYQKAFALAKSDEDQYFDMMYSFFQSTERTSLLKKQNNKSLKFKFPESLKNAGFLRKMMWFRIHYMLPEDMLIKTDRMSMANSLEVRTPFLDPELFEFSSSLADNSLIRSGKNKWIIREIMKNQLPDIVFNHPKTGFSIPLHKYFNEHFRKMSYDIVRPNHALNNIFDHKLVKKYLDQGFLQMQNTSKESVYKSAHKLWMLVQFYAWFDLFKLEID